MKKIPKVYVNPINKDIDNEQKYFRSGNINSNYSKGISLCDIDRVLNSNKHVYRSKVRLNINNNYVEKIIVSRSNNYLITIDNEKIPISNIFSIEEI